MLNYNGALRYTTVMRLQDAKPIWSSKVATVMRLQCAKLQWSSKVDNCDKVIRYRTTMEL